MLVVTKLRKQFSKILAVDNVSFDVRAGSVFGLIGPNGAGKSTTIRMIMDIIQPDSGVVMLEGKVMSDAAKNIIGYLPEERGLYRKNKLLNVVSYFGTLKGLSPKHARAAAHSWLERFSLREYEKRNVEELSKGNQQKVQFIIAVMHQPRLLVLDELFSGLDPVNQVLMRDALLKLKQENRGIVFSTHQMDLAEKLCDELMMIDGGRAVLHGSPSDIKRTWGKNALHAEFKGDASFLSTLPGVVRADIAQNYAEMELEPDVDTNRIIQAMLPRLEIASVSRVEPSLQSIFIDMVGITEKPIEKENAITFSGIGMHPIRDSLVKRYFMSGMLLLLLAAVILAVFVQEGNWIASTLGLLLLAGAVRSFIAFARRKAQLRKNAAREKEIEA